MTSSWSLILQLLRERIYKFIRTRPVFLQSSVCFSHSGLPVPLKWITVTTKRPAFSLQLNWVKQGGEVGQRKQLRAFNDLVSKNSKLPSVQWDPQPDSHVKSVLIFFFLSNAPHVLDGLRGLPSWPWQKCNRLLRLGRPWGAVTLSRWCELWYRRM